MNNVTAKEMKEEMELFFELLKQEFNIYEQMLALCRNEHGFIEAGDTVKLRASLSEKDKFLNKVVELEKELEPLKKKWHLYKDALSHDIRENILGMIEQFKNIAEEVMNKQKENEEYLFVENQKKTRELALIRKGKQLAKAYTGYNVSAPPSKIMDKKR